jgi:hypothetical protein
MTERQPTASFPTPDDSAAADFTPRATGNTATSPPAPAAEEGPLPRPFGRYELRRVLGSGGMGRVYLAHDPRLDRLVALKMPNVVAVPGWRERFLAEARAAATLNHANVCPVHEVGEEGGQPYLTMAYVEGETLAAKLARDGRPGVGAAVELVATVARAMQVAHRRGIVHRDLKPANLMIDDSGRPVVMDFGLAIRSEAGDDLRLTLTGVALGTPAYMPPEQAGGDGESIGPAADVYALGVILYELVTARLPFKGKSFGKLLAQIERDAPPPPSSLNPAADSALDAVILKCLAKRPADRFETAGDLANALARYLEGDRMGLVSLYSKPYLLPAETAEFQAAAAPTAEFRRPARRGWLVAAAAALLLAAGAVAGGVIFVQTDYGELEVRLSDPGAKVEVRVNGQQVALEADGKVTRVKAGPGQKLEVSGPGYETVAESFDLKRGGATIVQVRLRPKADVAQNTPRPESQPGGPKPPPAVAVAPPPSPSPGVAAAPAPREVVPKPVPFPEKPTLVELPGWQVLADATQEQMQKWLDERKKASHSVTWLDACAVADRPLFCAVAALDSRQPKWGTVLDMPTKEFRPGGAILKLMDIKRESFGSIAGYKSGGALRFAALWWPRVAGGYASPDDPIDETEKIVATEQKNGWYPAILRPFSIGVDNPRVSYYVAESLGEAPLFTWKVGASGRDQFTARARNAGQRVTSLVAYTRGGALEFAAVAWPNADKGEWQTDTNLTAAQLKAKATDLAARGFRPACVTACVWDGAVRYCAVWVKEPPKKGKGPGKKR